MLDDESIFLLGKTRKTGNCWPRFQGIQRWFS